jgi:hypothetical protein
LGGFLTLEYDVVVRVQGEEVFRKEHVTTRPQNGYVDSFEVRAEGEEVKIEVLLPLTEVISDHHIASPTH